MKSFIAAMAVFLSMALFACSNPQSSKSETHEARAQVPFDLGGPCNPGAPKPTIGLPGQREQDLYKTKDWNALVAAAKADIRNVCKNAYYWQRLFTILIDASRHGEAVQVAQEMKNRGFSVPHAVLDRAGPEFRASEEFRSSSFAAEYAKNDKEVRDAMQRAETRLASMAKEDLPPNPFNSRGACPFECCTYRRWETTRPVTLVESTASAKVIAQIPAGVSVVAITGEVHVEPEPYAVVTSIGKLKAGDVIFYLEPEGEGYMNYWYNGQLRPELDLDAGLTAFEYEACRAGGQEPCALRKMKPGKKFLSEWWVKIRTSDGKEGWTLNTGQFTNIDACG